MSNDSRDRNRDTSQPDAGFTGPGEYAPAGEAHGQEAEITADELADAFNVDIDRVHAAMQGEFGVDPGGTVGSAQAQELAEVLLGDLPLEEQQAALMKLGAFTPRTDHDWGVGEAPPSEESDRLKRRADRSDGERG